MTRTRRPDAPTRNPTKVRPRWDTPTCRRVPCFKRLADHRLISDNGYQTGMGSTGLDHILGCFGDALSCGDDHGNSATPSSSEIQHPNPAPGTDNWHVRDRYFGGSYSECSRASKAGVGPIVSHRKTLPTTIKPNCDLAHLPHPVATAASRYLPTNYLAIADIAGVVQFDDGRGGDSGQNW